MGFSYETIILTADDRIDAISALVLRKYVTYMTSPVIDSDLAQ